MTTPGTRAFYSAAKDHAGAVQPLALHGCQWPHWSLLRAPACSRRFGKTADPHGSTWYEACWALTNRTQSLTGAHRCVSYSRTSFCLPILGLVCGLFPGGAGVTHRVCVYRLSPRWLDPGVPDFAASQTDGRVNASTHGRRHAYPYICRFSPACTFGLT